MAYLSRRTIRRQRLTKEKIIASGLAATIVGVVALFLLSFIVFAIFSHDLPSPGKLRQVEGASTTFLDRDGKVIFQLYKDKNRLPITLAEIPADLKNGTVAIEDKDFYHHQGYSIRGVLRAFFNTVFRGKKEGGSTLTQQLVKNVLLTPERTLPRKIKEFILAVEIERRYSKDEIITMYLNEAPYGGSYWGVQSAAKGYFGKNAKELTLAQSAFLAGLPQRPSVYSPFIGKSGAYVVRTQNVLRRMREDGYITKKQETDALTQVGKMQFTSPKLSIAAPHFVFYVRDQLSQIFGEKVLEQGLTIKTTLSLDLQQKAEIIVKEEIDKVKSLHATNGASVVLDTQTGEILSMVGSYDYNDNEYGKYNTATALRQPGSAIKPITYAAAFEKGYTPATVLMDVKTVFPHQGEKDYTPENYDGKFRGPLQLRFALGNSINIPAVKLLAMIGVRNFLQKAFDMGLTTFEPTQANLNRFGLAITLGGGETRLLDLTSAYAIFGRGGVKKDYSSILEVKDFRGKTIYSAKPPSERRVLSTGVSFLISHILSDNNARSLVFGPRSYLNVPGKTVAVKTGTTNDKRDNWTVGFTKGVTVGVWVGNNDNSPMNEKIASGITGASPIWYRIIREALQKSPDGLMDIPDDVTAVEVDSFLGGLPRDGSSKRSEYFIKGTEPKDISPYYKKLKISKNTGKLANDIEIKQGEYDEKDFIVITESDPISTDGVNRWQQAINEWAGQLPDDKFKPPKDISDVKADELVTQIKEPADHARADGSSAKLVTKITSLDPVTKIEISVNGVVQKTYGEDKKETTDFLSLATGTYEIKVHAENSKGKSSDSTIHIGVNKDWNDGVTPTP